MQIINTLSNFSAHGFTEPWGDNMKENKIGKILLGAILLTALGAVVGANVSEYFIEKDAALQQSYYEGLTEMHNTMDNGAKLSAKEVVQLHQNTGCYSSTF